MRLFGVCGGESMESKEYWLSRVEEDWTALRHVKICIAAVKQNWRALQFVARQTPEICMTAVHQNGWALRYVKEQTQEICMAAVQKDPSAIVYIRD